MRYETSTKRSAADRQTTDDRRQTTDDDTGESDTHTSIHPSDQGKGTGRHEDAEETQGKSKLRGCKLANKLEARSSSTGRAGG